MLPTVNSVNISIPTQMNLVATPIPENHTLRVPVDNVPPNVSSVQVNNNARGNNTVLQDAAPEASTAPDSQETYPPFPRNPSATAGAQATFIAQLVGQEAPAALQPALQGLLNEYEKLVVFSFVKYKPSNATLPPPPPPGILGRILQQQSAARDVDTDTPAPIDNEPVMAIQPAQAEITQAEPAAEEQAEPAELFSYASAPAVSQVNLAYIAAAQRSDAREPASVESI